MINTRVHVLAILLHNHYITCSIAFGHTPIPILMYGLRVVVVLFYNVDKHVFVVFIVVSFHTHIQSFSFVTCPISQLCAQTCPYYNVCPGAVYCCFNKNYNVYQIFNMMLHAGLANPTCLQSFMVWYCSVCELHCLNSKKEKKMKNFGTYRKIGIFYKHLSHARIYMIFWSVV